MTTGGEVTAYSKERVQALPSSIVIRRRRSNSMSTDPGTQRPSQPAARSLPPRARWGCTELVESLPKLEGVRLGKQHLSKLLADVFTSCNTFVIYAKGGASIHVDQTMLSICFGSPSDTLRGVTQKSFGKLCAHAPA